MIVVRLVCTGFLEMVEQGDMVGALLNRQDDIGVADNTIVVHGTDNGAEVVT
jgi:arylsulfatase A-like enzyme